MRPALIKNLWNLNKPLNKAFLVFLITCCNPCFADSETTVGGKTGAAHIIQANGVSLRPRPYLNVTGDSVVGTDSGGKTVITISAPAGYTDAQAQSATGWTDGGTNVYLTTTTDTVGIGTTTASGTLEIVKQGSTVPFMVSSVATGDGNYLIVNSAGNVGIGTTSTSFGGLSVMNGNVGIGTWKPNSTLQVSGQNKIIEIGDLTNTTAYLSFQSGRTYSGLNSGNAVFQGGSGKGVQLAVNNGSFGSGIAVQVDTSGNVGIGTTTPVGGLVVMNGNVGIGTWSPPDKFIILGGNVGIGTARPMNKLQVNGTVQFDNSGSIGWSAVNGANTACNTTCVSGCVIGFDQGVLGVSLGSIVGCADATSDECICAGPS